MHLKHPVSKKTAVLSNPLLNSAKQSTHNKSYFSSYKKSKNKIKITLKSTEIMAKTDGSKEAAVSKKNSSKQQGSKDKLKPPTKIIIRHLPPTMTEEEFLQQIDPLPPHDFYYFAAADWSLGFDATCRAYITLKNYDDVFLFRDRFDGYVFVDAKGNEYAAIVEFAPFQGILKNKSRRTDNKVNTIEEEAHYQQFVVKLEEEREIASKGGDTKMEFNLNPKKEEITSTPLLQYLANKKEKRRLEAKKRVEEKRKLRDEEKDKRRQTVQEKNKEPQVTRILNVNSVAEKSQEGEAKKEQKSASEVEEKQSSRNKRRQERNQKRQEAFLQRKLQDKAAKSTESGELSATAENQHKENTEQTKQREKKEGKRERDRERNRMRRERREKAKEMAKAENRNERRNSGNDTVKVSKKILTKEEGQNANDEAAAAKSKSPERSDSKVDEEARKQRAAEERRVRNKDRPSIAIYQPKARLRQSEESDAGGNNGRQSDGERVNDTKKVEETQQVKKVSRYSERRKHSVAKDKRKSSVTDEEIATQAQPKEHEAIITADQQ